MKSYLIPIKCFTCGRVLADKYVIYSQTLASGQSGPSYLVNGSSEKSPQGHILDELGLHKSCCRRHMLGHVK